MISLDIERGEMIYHWSIWIHSGHVVMPQASIRRQLSKEIQKSPRELGVRAKHSVLFALYNPLSDYVIYQLVFLALLQY